MEWDKDAILQDCPTEREGNCVFSGNSPVPDNASFPSDLNCGRMRSTNNFAGFEMLDREGYRPNVGIILCNAKNEVFWGKRIREHSWQFPQGGIKRGETPEQAMFRELYEEVGLRIHSVMLDIMRISKEKNIYSTWYCI